MDDGDDMDAPPAPNVNEFCSLSEIADQSDNEFDIESATPAELENYWRSQAALVDQGTAVVPEKLRDDFALM